MVKKERGRACGSGCSVFLSRRATERLGEENSMWEKGGEKRMRGKERERESEKVTRKRNDFVGCCGIEREADQSGMVGRNREERGSLWDES